MNLTQAIRTSDLSIAQCLSADGTGWYVDGAGTPGFEVSPCVGGKPAYPTTYCEAIAEVAAMLPADVAASDTWEQVGNDVEILRGEQVEITLMPFANGRTQYSMRGQSIEARDDIAPAEMSREDVLAVLLDPIGLKEQDGRIVRQ